VGLRQKKRAEKDWENDALANIPWSVVSGGILVTIVVIGIFAVWRLLKERRSGFPLKDERTQKITGTAAYYAFYIGTYFMLALMGVNLLNQEFTGTPLLETGYALVISVLVQSLAFIGIQTYLSRKGDL
jgi:uncharacterized membrane protein